MSRATAEFFKPDGERVGYGLYDGTNDVMLPWIVATQERAWAVRYPEQPDHLKHGPSKSDAAWWTMQEECRHEGQPCIVYSDYGGGFYWPGFYCPACSVFLGPSNPYERGVYETVIHHEHPFPKAAHAVVETTCTE